MAKITYAGESLIAQKLGTHQVLDIARFVFANVPGLDPQKPINRAEVKPPANQIVHTYTIPADNRGYVNPNQVVYSSMLGSDIGDFDFNWVGLESAEGVLFAVAYLPLQQKRRNIPPAQLGNNITRNILVEFTGAQDLTGITINASTWQHDFTVRLAGIDERERLSNRDMFGRTCFFADALQVEKVGAAYQVRPGIAYIEGVRVYAAAALPVPGKALPTTVWLDVVLERQLNDVVARWSLVCEAALVDYKDSLGVQHYCIPLADISTQAIIDRREVELITGPLVQHFAARIGHYPQLRAGSATKLAEPRAINGVVFDGTQDITVADATKLPLAGGTLTGPLVFRDPAMGGAFDNWRARDAAQTVVALANDAGLMPWKAVSDSGRALAAMDAYSGGSDVSIPMVALHVGDLTQAFVFDGYGSLTIAGVFSGKGSSITALNASNLGSGTVPAARLSGSYAIDISGSAKSAGSSTTATRLEQARKINGVSFDGTQDINVADSTKLPLAGGTMTGPVFFNYQGLGGAFGNWRTREGAQGIVAANNGLAYMGWKATAGDGRSLAAMEVYAGGSNVSIPTLVFHVGATDSAVTMSGNGDFTIKGAYNGDGSGLTSLNASNLGSGTVPAARLSGSYSIDISGKAATATKLANPRAINGVTFDGTQDITVADSTKLPLAGGTMTGPTFFNFTGMAGGFVDWRTRQPALQINTPDNGAAYLVWRATNWNDRHLAAMDVYAGGAAGSSTVVTHVGNTVQAMMLADGGHLTIKGTFNGDGSGLKNLPAATASIAGVVRKNTASIAPNGWWKCAETGRIKQWGITKGASDTETHRSFPIAFPNACLSLVASRTSLFYNDVSTGTNTLIVSNSQFSVISGAFNSPDDIYWEATGH